MFYFCSLDRVRTNATAYNLYGILLERQELHSQACEAFANALKILEKSKDPESSDKREKVKANYARLLR